MASIEAAAPQRWMARRLSVEEWILAVIVVYFLGLRLLQTSLAPPMQDEPYYWLWGRHLALSYYDHPPLHGWIQGLSYQLFGKNVFALRWTTWAALAAELWVFVQVAQRIAGDEWRVMFLRSTAIFMAMPIYGVFTGFAYHDHLLVAFMMTSGYLFWRFFAEVEDGGRGGSALLFGGAGLLGLAVLTKYNGAFLGIAVAGAVLIRPKLRPLLLDWRLYAAALFAVALQAPVLIWNLQNGFESFLYQMGSRHGTTGFRGIDVVRLKAALGNALLMASPFIVPIIIRSFWASGGGTFERVGRTLAILLFWPCALVLLYIANFSWIMVWWTITIYVLFVPLAGRYATPGILGLHLLYGVIANTFSSVSYAVVPILLLFGIPHGMETESQHGWPIISQRVLDLQQEHGADFIAMNYAQNASELAYALDDPNVVAITPQKNTFDYWFDPALIGKDAIFVSPEGGEDNWRESFERVTELDTVPAQVWGYTVRTYRIYLAEGLTHMQ